jgi:DNA invertase Pin-like site-specific DNA recombinase
MVSSVDVKQRDQLAAAVEFVREADKLIVTKLDRLARSVAHLFSIVEALRAKKVDLRILDLNIDTSNSTGQLILTVLGGIAEFERQVMLERQREGIARAKREGKYLGRKPTARAKADQVRQLRAAGLSAEQIAAELRIGRSSVYRALGGGTGAER